MQRLDDARRVIRDWEARSQNKSGFWDIKFALAFLASDSAAMYEQQKQLAVQPPMSATCMYPTQRRMAGILAARELIKGAVDVAVRTDDKEKRGAILRAIGGQQSFPSRGPITLAAFFRLAEQPVGDAYPEG